LKTGILYISIVIILGLFSSNSALCQIPPGMKEAISIGNSQQLAKFFNKNIELLIEEKEEVYSKAQAELILKDFFNKHQPDTFRIESQGYSDGMNYIIGNLFTSNGKYRVYFTYYKNSNKHYISRLNITLF